MATFQSTSVTQNRPLRGPGIGGTRGGHLLATVTLPSTYTAGDILQFGYVPPDARVVGGWLKSADLDSNGTPTVTLSIGDSGNTSRFWTASNVAQAGGMAGTMNATGYNATYTSKTLIYGTVVAGGATATAGDVTVYISYTCEEPV